MKTVIRYALVAISLSAPATLAQTPPAWSRSAGMFEAGGVECLLTFCGLARADRPAPARSSAA